MIELEKINQFGCVEFDVIQNEKGAWVATPGPGWASIDGSPAIRINSISDLKLDVIWLSNLEQTVHWAAALYNTPQIKEARYLRTDINQIVREIGVSPKVVGPAHSAEAVAEVFGRVMRLAKTYCDRLTWGRATLIQELAHGLGLFDEPYENALLDEAFACSYQDRVDCANSFSPDSGERWITLRRPRLLHAQQLVGDSFLIPRGPWKFIGERDMPKKEERFEWLKKNFGGGPYMVKIKSMNFFKPSNEEKFDPKSLLQLGDSILPGRQRRQRQWMPMPELLYVSRFADIEFDSVCVGSFFDEPEKILPDLDYLMHHSYSWGVLAENIWMTYASRSINTKAQSKTLVSPRATWIRSIDRFYCFSSAIAIASKETKIMSYGTGSITLACKEGDMGEVIRKSIDAGLQVPASSYHNWKRWEDKEKAAQKSRQALPTSIAELFAEGRSMTTEEERNKAASSLGSGFAPPSPSFAVENKND